MPDHLRVILQNLLHNAQGGLTGGGEIILRGRNVELSQGEIPGIASGKFVEISVEDNGIGIDSEIIENIFDPYFTTKSRDSAKGIGLGLAIVHSIVKKNHGSITVKSGRESGSVFRVLLPAAITDIAKIGSDIV